MILVDIKKGFGKFKLDINFESNNETLGLLGASGSGKSLTLKCIAGIEKPDSGKIILNNKVIFDSENNINIRTQDRRVGYLFQDYALFPNMNILENIKTGIREKLVENEKNKIAINILKELELEDLARQMPYKLSGGQRQRVALGRILANKPEILLLDEPFSALDDFLKWKIELNVKELIQKYNLPSIFVSHNRDEIYRICDSISIIREGKSEEKASTQELFRNPKTLSAALISGCKNFSYIDKLDKNHVFAKDWGLELKVNNIEDENVIGIRSHNVKIIINEEENSFKINKFIEIDDIFESVLLVDTPYNKGQFGKIRIALQKEKWNKLKQLGNLYVKINEEDIFLLKSKEWLWIIKNKFNLIKGLKNY